MKMILNGNAFVFSESYIPSEKAAGFHSINSIVVAMGIKKKEVVFIYL